MIESRIERLYDFLESVKDRPFVWGEFDCAIFAADAVLAVTGKDPLAELRPVWTPSYAMRLAARLDSLQATADRLLGPVVPPAFARRCDVVLMANEGRPALGICAGPHAAMPGNYGLVQRDMADCIRAWRTE